jgi:hypothetical protein
MLASLRKFVKRGAVDIRSAHLRSFELPAMRQQLLARRHAGHGRSELRLEFGAVTTPHDLLESVLVST